MSAMAYQLAEVFLWATLVFLSYFESPKIGPNVLRKESLLRQNASDSDSPQGVTKYYLSREAADFIEADEVCKESGPGSGLAVILTKDDLKEIMNYLSNKSPRSHVWIGGSWSTTHKTFVWVNRVDANGQPLPFADFVLELFESNLPTPNVNDRTIFYIADQFKAVLEVEYFTSTRRFLCQNNNSWNQTTTAAPQTTTLPPVAV